METQTPALPQVQADIPAGPALRLYEILGLPPTEQFDYQAALYFLDDGHYLFRFRGDHSEVGSKFVSAADVKAAFSSAESDTGWIDPGIVRCGYGPEGHWFVQFVPMQRMEIVLDGLGPLTVPVPPLAMFGYGRSYAVCALKAKHFSPEAQVYAAPFPNVDNHTGKICWGHNSPPEAEHKNSLRVWKLFLDAPFSDHTIENKSRKHPDDIRLTLRELAEKGAGGYPLGDLEPMKGYRPTVASILNGILREGR